MDNLLNADSVSILWPVAVIGFLLKDMYLTFRGDSKDLIIAVQTLTNEITRLNGHVEGLQKEVDTLSSIRTEIGQAWIAIRVLESKVK